MCSPHLCKYGDCKAGHSLMTQRNIDYLERRGLVHVEPMDIIALFRIVDENKYGLYLIDFLIIFIFKKTFKYLSISI